jgi:hypothetical protein
MNTALNFGEVFFINPTLFVLSVVSSTGFNEAKDEHHSCTETQANSVQRLLRT